MGFFERFMGSSTEKPPVPPAEKPKAPQAPKAAGGESWEQKEARKFLADMGRETATEDDARVIKFTGEAVKDDRIARPGLNTSYVSGSRPSKGQDKKVA